MVVSALGPSWLASWQECTLLRTGLESRVWGESPLLPHTQSLGRQIPGPRWSPRFCWNRIRSQGPGCWRADWSSWGSPVHLELQVQQVAGQGQVSDGAGCVHDASVYGRERNGASRMLAYLLTKRIRGLPDLEG